ncbi:hypothetical protein [Nannocystis bainbridge]|uniref:Uncharacterized protein n=1 Tax=Nannocystis bainbridge TaxID=2995303 RepID=A0ABT5E3G6_9BACT|nr:hypothetical protein [Nannocystis bainbridge]MDC0719945.1 hypothetical protein [Nannocystis bainbridge]
MLMPVSWIDFVLGGFMALYAATQWRAALQTLGYRPTGDGRQPEGPPQ